MQENLGEKGRNKMKLTCTVLVKIAVFHRGKLTIKIKTKM